MPLNSPLYFFFVPIIISNLKSFISGTSDVLFEIFFCSNIAASKTSFLGAPSEVRPHQTECMWCILSRSSFRSFFPAAFLKKRISTLIKSFISGTSDVLFEIFFCSNIAASKTSFLGAPSEVRPHQTECMWCILSRSSFRSFFPAAFLKKRISTLIKSFISGTSDVLF